MKRVRVRRCRYTLPLTVRMTRRSRVLYHTVFIDFAAHAIMRIPRSPFTAQYPTLARRQRALEWASLSPATRRRQCENDLEFLRFLQALDLPLRDAAPMHVLTWLGTLRQTRSAEHCRRAYGAVRNLLRLRGLFDPVDDAGIGLALKALRRQAGRTHPALQDCAMLRSLVATCDDSLAGRRDRAVILLFAAGVTYREFAPLHCRQLRYRNGGVEYPGRLGMRGLSPGAYPETCPVLALQALTRDAHADDYVICSLHDRAAPITFNQVYVVLKRRCTAAGYPVTHGRALRLRFLWSLGQLGFNDSAFSILANFAFAVTGRRYNATRNALTASRVHSARRMRSDRHFPRSHYADN